MKKITILLIATCLLTVKGYSQHYPPAHKGNSVDTTAIEKPQLDITDLWRELWGKPYKAHFDSSKITKDKPYIAFIPAIGYTVQTSFTAVATLNLSFYTDDRKNSNISSIYGSTNFSLLHQIVIPVITNIWSSGNEFNFLGDYR